MHAMLKVCQSDEDMKVSVMQTRVIIEFKFPSES